jgi:acyl carrier protein
MIGNILVFLLKGSTFEKNNNMNDFINNFADQFDETERSEFTKDTQFKNLDEWDSMIALSIIAMMDEEYEVTINGDDIKKANTIEDLFQVIETN